MKRMTCFVMALALVLGLAQCKKEQPETPQNEGNSVMITLNVNGDASTVSANKGTRVNVDPNGNPMVTFVNGDKIEVASNGLHVGTLTYNYDNDNDNDEGTFSGRITNATYGEPLYFYFFGNVTPQYFGGSQSNCSVYIGEQTGDLPVISMGPSINPETGAIVNFEKDGVRSFSARLHNKCSLMKFNVTNETDSSIYINGMNNFIKIDFTKAANDNEYNGFSYSQVYNGKIEMKGQEGSGQKTYWAIVLPQDYVEEGGAYTEDYTSIGTRPKIAGGIGLNQYYSEGIDISMISYDPLGTPLTFEAMSDGTTVTINKEGSKPNNAPPVTLYTSTDGYNWTNFTVGSTTITLAEGETVMFRGTNNQFAISMNSYNNFSIDGECYVYGNIMSLIDATNYATTTSLGESEQNKYTFASLFAGCEGLCDHSQKPLELPATGLATYCYSYMFSGCTGLTVAPKLPASGLQEGCYKGMFEYCESLEESPVLPATKLVEDCYSTMFSGCSNLSHVTCLAEEGINVSSSTSGWLSGVATSGTFTRSASLDDGDWPTGNNGIPNLWSVNY